MLRRIHNLLTGSGCVLLGIIGSDEKNWISLVGMFGNMPCGAMTPLAKYVSTSSSL